MLLAKCCLNNRIWRKTLVLMQVEFINHRKFNVFYCHMIFGMNHLPGSVTNCVFKLSNYLHIDKDILQFYVQSKLKAG
jgi:hypothetical protein